VEALEEVASAIFVKLRFEDYDTLQRYSRPDCEFTEEEVAQFMEELKAAAPLIQEQAAV
jgi:hypothetical protein